MVRSIAPCACLLAMAAPLAAADGLRETSCHVNGFETPVRCVEIDVPLDYAAPDGVTTVIAAAIAPAATARPARDPLFVLAGGPGQAGTDMAAWLNTAFRPARRERDIVLVDFRGTGRSDALACDLPAELDARLEALQRAAAECARRYGGRVRYYTHREVVEDLERLRLALGYERINLWGGSFGTRAAQHYVRAYAAHVRSVVLDGATPIGQSIVATAPHTGEQALERLFADCAGDRRCAAAFPKLRVQLNELLHRADRAPIEVEVPDPRTGRPINVSLGRDALVNLLRGPMYVGFSRAVLPHAVTAAANGDLRPLLALGAATGEWSTETMSLGFLLGILCSEDIAQSAHADRADVTAGFMRDSYFRVFAAYCAVWPTVPLSPAMLAPLSTQLPALAISGEADPVTPPSLGEATLAGFSPRVHVIVPDGFHTNSANPCVAETIGAFLGNPADGLDHDHHACLAATAPAPRFFVAGRQQESRR